ncbi:DUF6157 family protein [Jiella mangrovi]|uniref:Uncharacterized protein n=1 Tax=Jiella mangrovi TaxID=2821407 RepID=A0ABS4BNJ9_9HYPH|nr:DUF6157 family protein [Jiella mangrovi]MBP0618326.1 hypothetical protein [Jiella mangrovi]
MMHSTNYSNTLISPAEDCQTVSKIPEKTGSVAALQYELMVGKPYELTSDDVLSTVAATRKGIDPEDLGSFRQDYFSKGQPCFRASPLTKTHGWAVHSDENGFVALLAPDGPEFAELMEDDDVKKINAMRNKRA